MFFVFIFEDYELSLKMIQYVTELKKKNKTIIVFNTNLLTEETKKCMCTSFPIIDQLFGSSLKNLLPGFILLSRYSTIV